MVRSAEIFELSRYRDSSKKIAGRPDNRRCQARSSRACGDLRGRLFFFFLEGQVGNGGAGGDLGLMGDACRDVDDFSGVEDGFFSALDAGAEGLAGGGAVGMFSLEGAAGDEGDCAFLDNHLVGPELVTFGVSAVDAHDEEGAVVAKVVHDVCAEAGWAGFGCGQELGFALLHVRVGVDGLSDEGWGGDEGEGQDDARWHSDSLGGCQIVLCGWVSRRTAGWGLTSHP